MVFCIQLKTRIHGTFLWMMPAVIDSLKNSKMADWRPFSEIQKMLDNSLNKTLTGLVCNDIKYEIRVTEPTDDISFALRPFFHGHL